MCLSCGCGQPHDDHGDPRHITQEEIEQAAEAAGISPDQAAKNIAEGIKQTTGSQGQGWLE